MAHISMETIRHYNITKLLGTGGMGAVYLAFDTRLERQVAIKMPHTSRVGSTENPHSSPSQAELAAEMLQEARLLAKLSHPNIVTIYEFGEVANVPYVVMEYLTGESLQKLIPASGMPAEKAITIVRQLLSALAFAHGLGILHRDIKPHNIWITANETVKLLDFGIARGGENFGRVAAGTTMGTIEYMAPELLNGETADARVDVYAAGCVLYELLTGRLPYVGDYAAAIIHQKISGNPPAPESLQPGIDQQLSRLVLRSLASRREERIASAKIFIEMLDGYVDDLRLKKLQTKNVITPAQPGNKDSVSAAVLQDGSLQLKPCFVGRQREMETMQAAMQNVVEGNGKALLLSGEAGAGKTRLAKRFEEMARLQGWLVVNVEFLFEEGFPPCWPCREGIRNFLQAAPTQMEEAEYANFLSAIKQRLPFFGAHLQTLGGINAAIISPAENNAVDSTENFTTESMPERIGAFLQLLAEMRPVMLVMDNLQWADEASLKLLYYLARLARNSRLLLLPILRNDPSDLKPAGPTSLLHRLRHEDLLSDLAVTCLSREAHDQLIEASLGKCELSDDFYDHLYQKSAGNPFIVLEFLKHFSAQDRLFQDAGIWKDRPPWRTKSVPDRVEGLFLGRLMGVHGDDREIVEAAAVIGYRFAPDLLEAVTGRERLQILKALHRLAEDGKIVINEDGSHRFDHPMLREVWYAKIPRALRAEYHLLVARALEKRRADRDAQTMAEIGEHFRSAGHHAEALPYLYTGASAAFESASHSRAALLLNELLDSLMQAGTKFSSQKDAILKLAVCLEELGRWREAQEKLYELQKLAEAEQELNWQIDVLCHLGRMAQKSGQPEQALSFYEKCLQLYESDRHAACPTNKIGVSRIYNNVGVIYFERGDFENALRYFEKTAQAADTIDGENDCAHANTNIGIIMNMQGRYQDSLQYYNNALAIYEKRHDEQSVARVYHNLGLTYTDLGNFAQAIDYLTRSMNLAETVEDRQLWALATLNLGKLCMLKRDYKSTKKHVLRALRFFRRANDTLSVAEAYQIFGRVNLELGKVADAKKFFNQSLQYNSKASYKEGMAENYFYLGRALLQAGEHEEAKHHLERAHKFYEELNSTGKIDEIIKLL
jgi:serine/threonine protein kinase/tetratricopeptide (TPR) repeat protein